jgi:hypothetical protein
MSSVPEIAMAAQALALALGIHSTDRVPLDLTLTKQPVDPVAARMPFAFEEACLVARCTWWVFVHWRGCGRSRRLLRETFLLPVPNVLRVAAALGLTLALGDAPVTTVLKHGAHCALLGTRIRWRARRRIGETNMRARALALALGSYGIDRLPLGVAFPNQPIDPLTARMPLALEEACLVARMTWWVLVHWRRCRRCRRLLWETFVLPVCDVLGVTAASGLTLALGDAPITAVLEHVVHCALLRIRVRWWARRRVGETTMRARALALALGIYRTDRLPLVMTFTNQPIHPLAARMPFTLEEACLVARKTGCSPRWVIGHRWCDRLA